MLEIIDVLEKRQYLPFLKSLFSEYAGSLEFDLDFQDFETELSSLPGKYSSPGGALLLALFKGSPAGCGAMHPCSGDVLEMKRLYVNPYFQGLSIGRKLAEKLIELARSSGFSFIKLDNVVTMTSEIALYNSPGFREIPPHCSNPVPGAFLPWN